MGHVGEEPKLEEAGGWVVSPPWSLYVRPRRDFEPESDRIEFEDQTILAALRSLYWREDEEPVARQPSEGRTLFQKPVECIFFVKVKSLYIQSGMCYISPRLSSFPAYLPKKDA